MPVVGTAGHVDHGKSTLVKALTGHEPDRWAEEQERGLTIDLGFAWTDLGDGLEVSFVDVPGHDRFIKNMLAGVEAIDVALFVVAADEGWMPQSEEHLAVLDLLGVELGVVALTKIDRVDDDLIELATLEVEEHLAGSSLAGASIIPVSAADRLGLEELIAALRDSLARVRRNDNGRPRMWIDRTFSIAGAGTVVTGTLLDSGLAVGDDLKIFPEGDPVRIRTLQSHEQELETVEPHRRVAVNLSGVGRTDITRGDMLGRSGDWLTTSRFVGTIRPARYVEELANRGAYHLHIGSGSYPVRIRMLGSDLVVIDLPTPIAIAAKDRFILRDAGRRLVVGGGMVLVPDPPRTRRFTPDLVAALTAATTPDQTAQALLGLRGTESIDRLSAHSGGGNPTDSVIASGFAMDPAAATDRTGRIVAVVEQFHTEFPLRTGVGVAELADRIGVSLPMLNVLVDLIDEVVIEGAVATTAGRTVAFSDVDQSEIDRVKDALLAAGTGAVPRLTELNLSPELLHAAVRAGTLVQVSSEFVYLPSQIDELSSAISSFAEPFGVSEFREAAGVSRKYAVPFLEWADNTGLTVRMGDKRRRRD